MIEGKIKKPTTGSKEETEGIEERDLIAEAAWHVEELPIAGKKTAAGTAVASNAEMLLGDNINIPSRVLK
jgi:hypothetical protein